jgi:polymorphic toxin system nucleotidyltransferase-like protein
MHARHPTLLRQDGGLCRTIGDVRYNSDVRERLYRVTPAERASIGAALRDEMSRSRLVQFAYLHGSFLTSPAFRDIDVAIQFTDGVTDAADLALQIGETLSRVAGFPVDAHALNDAPLSFRFHAMTGELLVSRDDEELTKLLEKTMRDYFDIEPILRRATRDAFVR